MAHGPQLSLTVENRRMSYAVAMNIDNTDTCHKKSRGFLQALLLPKKTLDSKMLYCDISCPCYAI